MHLIRHHERGIESQSEMSDNLVGIALVLIFFNKIGCAGESNLVDILFHLVRSHSQAVVGECQCLLLRIHHHVDTGLEAFGQCILTHHIQLL